MKQTKLLLLFFTSLLVFGLMNIDVENIIILQESTENVFLDRKMLPAYTSHEAIRIVNNTDFIWQAGNESWLGDGSEEYPYIIHGYNITDDTTDGIYIRDVSIYFEIRDCLITSTGIRYGYGIVLYNVSHCHLENCIISYKNVGLYLTGSNGISTINCTVDNNAHSSLINNSNHTSFHRCHFANTTTGTGLALQDSLWVNVTSCHFEANYYYGLVGTRCDHLNFTDNVAVDNKAGGLSVYDSDYSTIHNNTVFNNSLVGIHMDEEGFCNVTSNKVYNHDEYGIFMQLTSDVLISHNIVCHNDHFGIFLLECDGALVYYNDFGWNPINARDQTSLPNVNYWHYGGIGNWWSDYGGAGPYTISSNIYDMHPSMSFLLIPMPDKQYELGSMGNMLAVGALALNPWYYEVCVESEVLDTVDWNGTTIYVNIDGLDVGQYNFTIRAFHISGYMKSQSAMVTVVDTTPPEWVIIPSDQTLNCNESLCYQIQAIDFSEIDTWIINDTLHFNILNGVITNSTILDAGDYGLNITVVDVYGNARSAVITIHLLPIGEPNLIGSYLILGSVVVLVAIVAVVIIKKQS